MAFQQDVYADKCPGKRCDKAKQASDCDACVPQVQIFSDERQVKFRGWRLTMPKGAGFYLLIAVLLLSFRR